MNRHAGVYIWVDLRPYFVSSIERKRQDYSSLRATSACSEIHEQREAEIVDICLQNGVMIAPGSSYRAEEYGWFRITFTCPKAPLQEGLHRFWTSLVQLQASNGF